MPPGLFVSVVHLDLGQLHSDQVILLCDGQQIVQVLLVQVVEGFLQVANNAVDLLFAGRFLS